jgi:hypothetical protein
MFKSRVSTKTMVITAMATIRGGAARKFNADAVLANKNKASRAFAGFARELIRKKAAGRSIQTRGPIPTITIEVLVEVKVAQAEGLLRV